MKTELPPIAYKSLSKEDRWAHTHMCTSLKISHAYFSLEGKYNEEDYNFNATNARI
jgi:hypothetical protein